MHIVYTISGIYRSIGCLILIFVLYKRNTKAQFVAPYAALSSGSTLYNIVGLLSVCLLILLPLNLRIVMPGLTQTQATYAVQVLFDVSLSMTATDLAPSRFTVAKKFVTNLIAQFPHYQRSTLFFSGLPVLRTAYSTDNNALLHNLSTLSMGDFPPSEDFVGTAIGDALLLALGNITHIQGDIRPFFILITDGDSNKGYDPYQVLPSLEKLKIPVYTIGLGLGSTIIGTDTFGTNVYTTINVDLLKDIAKKTGGEFFYVEKPSDFAVIAESIKKTLQNSESSHKVSQFISCNTYIVWILSVLLSYMICYRIYALRRLD